MAEVSVEGCRLFFNVEGPENAPWLLLSNSLGTTIDLWAGQLGRFTQSFRVVRYDTRGHGRSDAPSGPYTLDQLGTDALMILDAAGAARAHVCGISIGGLTAMWMALHAHERIDRLVAANTAARIGTAELWDDRIRTVRSAGTAALAEATMTRWFTQQFRQRHPSTVDAFRSMVAACSSDGYAGCCAALRDADLRDDLHRIIAPTLVVTGTHDVATPPAGADVIRERIPGARKLALDCAHLSNVEQAEAFTSAVVEFLSSRRALQICRSAGL
jgi:3-oxoadipate enol-lactonase